KKTRAAKATRGKKATTRKPVRPGRITATPKTKKHPQAKTDRRPKKLNTKAAKPAAKKKITTAKKVAGISHARKAAVAKPRVTGKPTQKLRSKRALLARRRALAPKPIPAPPKRPPSPGTLAAVRAFEQALRLFNRQDFSAARPVFASLIEKFAEQAEIVARVRTYLSICEQRLARTPTVPRNSDALYNQGVFEFNKGNTKEAIELFEKALKAEPRADHVYYSLAAAYARLDNVQKALDALRHAIGI